MTTPLIARSPHDDLRAFEAAARILGAKPTQGKCSRCRRFYYFRGPGRFKSIAARTCPECRLPLSRTSGLSTLPRFTISTRGSAEPLELEAIG